jgi:hypothetical protein
MKGLAKESGWRRWLDHSYRHIQKDLPVATESDFNRANHTRTSLATASMYSTQLKSVLNRRQSGSNVMKSAFERTR